MKVSVENRQKTVDIDEERVCALIMRLCRMACACLKKDAAGFPQEIGVIFTGHSGIRRIHAAAMGLSGNTDVITLRYGATPHSEETGELAVNACMAREKAEDAGWTVCDELALYIAHGLDHLAGWDDASPRQYTAMRRRELGWLEECRRENLIDRICRSS